MNRRHLLRGAGTALLAAIGGCTGALDAADDVPSDDDSDDDDEGIVGPEIPMVDDPPDVVYIPTHREGMLMPEPVQGGELMVGPMITYPHPFWLVSGTSAEEVAVTEDDDIHLMATVWDPETNTVIPTDEGLSMEITKDGELVDSRAPWTMLSQTMGAHFGDNVPLDGDGTYEVEVTVPSVSTRLTGELEGRFQASGSASFEFTFDRDTIQEAIDMIEWVDEEHWGEPGAIDPGHDHDHDDGHDHHDHDHDHELGEPVSHATVTMETHDDGTHHFIPHVVHVEAGGTVEWTLESGHHDTAALHPETHGPQARIPAAAEPWASDMLDAEGETFERVFEVEGVYDYVCTPHAAEGMVGSIIVGDPDPADQPGLAAPDEEYDENVAEWIEHYNQQVLAALDDDHGHDHDAHDHHGHDHPPFSALPQADDLPGTYQGTGMSGDADIVVTTVTDPGRFTEEVPYVLVSPRTPYNRVPLPDMALTLIIERDGEQIGETGLSETIDHDAGHHYGVSVPDLQAGDALTIEVDTPPQTSRHQGYETAFIDMPPVEVTIDDP